MTFEGKKPKERQKISKNLKNGKLHKKTAKICDNKS